MLRPIVCLLTLALSAAGAWAAPLTPEAMWALERIAPPTVSPDGKSAVFTDPTTRLPKQFKVGDKLTGGDTIKSIDAVQGKVIAGTKEYSLD